MNQETETTENIEEINEIIEENCDETEMSTEEYIDKLKQYLDTSVKEHARL